MGAFLEESIPQNTKEIFGLVPRRKEGGIEEVYDVLYSPRLRNGGEQGILFDTFHNRDLRLLFPRHQITALIFTGISGDGRENII